MDDGFDVKELMALAEPIPVSPPKRMLTLDSAGDALRRTGYDLVNRIEQRGDRNLVCEFTLRGRLQPLTGSSKPVGTYDNFSNGRGSTYPWITFWPAPMVYLAFLVWFSGQG